MSPFISIMRNIFMRNVFIRNAFMTNIVASLKLFYFIIKIKSSKV